MVEPTTTGGLSAANKTMKPQLINGWKTWHKWWSTRLKIVGLLLIAAPEAIITAWASIPLDMDALYPYLAPVTTYDEEGNETGYI